MRVYLHFGGILDVGSEPLIELPLSGHLLGALGLHSGTTGRRRFTVSIRSVLFLTNSFEQTHALPPFSAPKESPERAQMGSGMFADVIECFILKGGRSGCILTPKFLWR